MELYHKSRCICNSADLFNFFFLLTETESGNMI